jgi:hypothetical protein
MVIKPQSIKLALELEILQVLVVVFSVHLRTEANQQDGFLNA